jgi:hypothetical protein
MKKLAMSIDQLRVESYETGAGETRERGTVQGNSDPNPQLTYSYDFTCRGSTCGLQTNAPRCYGAAGAEQGAQEEL